MDDNAQECLLLCQDSMADDTSVLFNFPSSARHNPIEGLALERDLVVLPLLNTVLFPHMLASLFLSSESAIAAVDSAVTGDRLVLAVAQREIDTDPATLHDVYTVGVEAHVQRMRKMPDGTLSVVLQGRRRMRLLEQTTDEPPIYARAAPLYVDEEHTLAVQAMMRAVLALFEKVVRLSRTLPDDAYTTAMNVDEPGWLADLIASTLPLGIAQRQQILETLDPEERLHRITTLLTQELDVLELESRIQTQVQQEVDRSQREFFLREQLKVIQRELGQDDPAQREINQLRARVLSSGMSEQARNRASEELDRLETMAPAAPEYAVIRTYLDWLLRLPWQHATDDTSDLRAAARLLNDQHYGLSRVKERILEFMAVRILAGPFHRSPILCFVGPPGVGKTSLGKSIAEALGRRFVRLSLGGVHDEAEIRGHRRTYIGAMPGRIIQMMKEAGTVNPLFMLDEVDKLGSDFRGDPAAALLEVLDPEQNNTFADHYLDLPYDLSKVTFITTANFADEIPEPLLDRMELIELHGYTEEEKFQIARRFLLPKQFAACGLPQGTLTFGEAALRELIRSYTYEAGVRNLEREIGAVCRKIARRIAEGKTHPRLVTPALIHKYLGPPRYSNGVAEECDQVGVATGMVYTSNGGDIMPVEVSLMEGKGGLMLTGQLGEVMQESAQAALSYARANAKALDIDARRFDKLDIHIHVPEGGVPKDGPSAGVTIAAALISALSGRTVRRDVAMTGEITLRGRVLPIGGIKEKVLGAYRAGLRTILLPEKNRRDVVEIPSRVRAQLTLIYITQIEQALELLLGPVPEEEPKRARRAGKKSGDG
jgi:ATP-dependent Lon protease